MEFENIIKLIQTVSDSELSKFSYEENGIKLELKKEKEQLLVSGVQQTVLTQQMAEKEGITVMTTQPEVKDEKKPSGNVILSPLVGTFYQSPSPEDEPFVKVGDCVKKGQVLGILEAMKLMNEIESEYDGIVKEILVENGDVIEYGQPMFVIG